VHREHKELLAHKALKVYKGRLEHKELQVT
jgi:hypothetical protein